MEKVGLGTILFETFPSVAVLSPMAAVDCYSDQAFPLWLVKSGSFGH